MRALTDRSRSFAGGGAVVVACVGLTVLGGWLFEVQALKQVFPGLATMKANTAVCFLASGLSLLALRMDPPKRLLARALALGVLAIALATLGEYLSGWNGGFDELLFQDISPAGQAAASHPGRMAPATTIAFVFTGTSLLLTRRRGGAGSLARWLSIPPLFAAVLALTGYAYNVRAFYAIGPFASMALNTAATFLILSLSTIAVDPTDGFIAILLSDTIGGSSARRLLPFTTVLLFVLGWLRLAGQHAGYYDADFGLALMVVSSIVVTSSVVAWHAVLLHRADLRRRADDASILALNRQLEQRVEQLGKLLPICAWCKRIRDERDDWHSVEEHVSARTTTRFTHAMCPDCARKMVDDPAPAR